MPWAASGEVLTLAAPVSAAIASTFATLPGLVFSTKPAASPPTMPR